ncbi:MAG: thiolase family protein [Deltaproteobacteria bacterium]|nr:thiolase family protein [Deltaproteobacteria bacterium]MBI3387465.1 thiolase family protein [Deltaproteobacteria bacterium]
MRFNAVIAGVGMTQFGKHMETGLKALGAQAVHAAIADAGLEARDLEAAFVGNAAAGLVTGQECIRGQVILRSIGIGRIPVVNVENACASASTALNQACAMVTAGFYDVVLALGVEKLYHPDKRKSFAAFSGAVDVEIMAGLLEALRAGAQAQGGESAGTGAGEKRSMFMDIYAAAARAHMHHYGTTVEQFAAIAAKNSLHGSMNRRAQFREVMSVADVLAAPMIAEPLTRPMCSPIGDGAAAVVVISERKARALGIKNPVRVVSSVLHSGWDHGSDEPGTVEVCASEAYAEAGVGPNDLSVIECHDASAPAELMAYESLGLCAKGEGGKLVDSGSTKLGGQIPVNTSGGLLRKGHPVGATGIAQIVELTEQLQGRSGQRQVEHAHVALAHNGGGAIGTDAAAMCVTILIR